MSGKKVKGGRGRKYNVVRADIRAARELAAKVHGRGLLRVIRPLADMLESIAVRLGK